VGRTNDKADEAIEAVGQTNTKADAAIEAVGRTNDRADAAIGGVEGTSSRADALVGRAEGMVGRVEPILDDYAPALTALAPSVRRLAASLEPHEVEALVTLVDRLPQLMTHLDEDIFPILETLGDVGPNLTDLVETVQDMRQVVKGFPGSRLFRRRGAEEIAEEEARDEG
jgi:ABC-type transporter Mla subunit MlaD